MGVYFRIVNPAKRQYIDADYFNSNIKVSGLLHGHHCTALAFLVCNIDQVRDDRDKPLYDFGLLAGSWCGDPVYVVTDCHGKPDEFGIQTSSSKDPQRNLYFLAKEEFENISYKAIAMICNGREEIADEMTAWAADYRKMFRVSVNGRDYSNQPLVHLGNAVFLAGCPPLERSLAKEFGEDWVREYKKAWETSIIDN